MALKKEGGKEQQCTQREPGNFEEKCVQNRNGTAVIRNKSQFYTI